MAAVLAFSRSFPSLAFANVTVDDVKAHGEPGCYLCAGEAPAGNALVKRVPCTGDVNSPLLPLYIALAGAAFIL